MHTDIEVKEGGAVVGCELDGSVFHGLIPFDIRKFCKCGLKPRATGQAVSSLPW